ncbi:hypothetical protein C6W23_09790 [Bacillus atrophaeus]|nr:hypothetical protein C6W23_09790 [Bacillus atrophaeus]
MTTLGGYISLPPLLVDVCFQDIDIYVYIIKSKPSNLNIEFVQLPNIDHISMFRMMKKITILQQVNILFN